MVAAAKHWQLGGEAATSLRLEPFAGLRSTIRGHYHPTMREEVEFKKNKRGGEAKGPCLIQQQQQPLQDSSADEGNDCRHEKPRNNVDEIKNI